MSKKMKFYIFSTAYSPDWQGCFMWWRPKGCGYTGNLNEAGKFGGDSEEVRRVDGEKDIAVPVEAVDKMAVDLRVVKYHYALANALGFTGAMLKPKQSSVA